jgi:hypothetical protein
MSTDLKQKISSDIKILLEQYLRIVIDPKGTEINFQNMSEKIAQYFINDHIQPAMTKEKYIQYKLGADMILNTLEKEAVSTRSRFPRESDFWLDRLRRTRIALAQIKQPD